MKNIFCILYDTKMTSITNEEVQNSFETIKKFSLYCFNVDNDEFLNLMHPKVHPSYAEEKLMRFRQDPAGYFLSLDPSKQKLLISAVLATYNGHY